MGRRGGEEVGELAREGAGVGVGPADRSWSREGEREEVGQGPGRGQEEEECEGKKGGASDPDALQLLLVSDEPSQVQQLLQRHPAQGVAVDTPTAAL